MAVAWGREPPFTTRRPDLEVCIDYIWASQGHWTVEAALELPYPWRHRQAAGAGSCSGGGGAEAEGAGENGAAAEQLPYMPNADCPSDHLALGARLALTA